MAYDGRIIRSREELLRSGRLVARGSPQAHHTVGWSPGEPAYSSRTPSCDFSVNRHFAEPPTPPPEAVLWSPAPLPQDQAWRQQHQQQQLRFQQVHHLQQQLQQQPLQQQEQQQLLQQMPIESGQAMASSGTENLASQEGEVYDLLSIFQDYIMTPVAEGFDALFGAGPDLFGPSEQAGEGAVAEEAFSSQPWPPDDFPPHAWDEQPEPVFVDHECAHAQYADHAGFSPQMSPMEPMSARDEFFSGGLSSGPGMNHQDIGRHFDNIVNRVGPPSILHQPAEHLGGYLRPDDGARFVQGYSCASMHHPAHEDRLGVGSLNPPAGPSVFSDVLVTGYEPGGEAIAANFAPITYGLGWLGESFDGALRDTDPAQLEPLLQRVPLSPSSADGLGLDPMQADFLKPELYGSAMSHSFRSRAEEAYGSGVIGSLRSAVGTGTPPPASTPPILMGPPLAGLYQAPALSVPTPPISPDKLRPLTARLASTEPRFLPGTGLEDVTSDDLSGGVQRDGHVPGHVTPGGGGYYVSDEGMEVPFGRFAGHRLATIVA